jgi:hypothetical protein
MDAEALAGFSGEPMFDDAPKADADAPKRALAPGAICTRSDGDVRRAVAAAVVLAFMDDEATGGSDGRVLLAPRVDDDAAAAEGRGLRDCGGCEGRVLLVVEELLRWR